MIVLLGLVNAGILLAELHRRHLHYRAELLREFRGSKRLCLRLANQAFGDDPRVTRALQMLTLTMCSLLLAGCINTPPPDAKRALFPGTKSMVSCLSNAFTEDQVYDQKWSMTTDDIQVRRGGVGDDADDDVVSIQIFKSVESLEKAMAEDEEFYSNKDEGDGTESSNEYQRDEKSKLEDPIVVGRLLLEYRKDTKESVKERTNECVADFEAKYVKTSESS